MTRHVALYLRISKTSADSIADQEMQGREYAAVTWPGVPVVIYAEDGFSGEKDDVVRPAYDLLRAAVARGEVARLWCAEQYRLERNEVRWFRLRAELVDGGVTELHTRREGIVRVEDEIASLRAVLGAGEVRRLRRRVNDKLATNAARGNAPAAIVFGYVRAGKSYEIVPEQAAEIRQAAERVLSGWSLTHLVDDLDERGVRPARGGKFAASSVKSMLTNPSVAGLRVYRGEVVGAGNWPAILDEVTWRSVRAKLSSPRQVERRDGKGSYAVGESMFIVSAGRKYLLTSGLAVCGVCGTPLVGAPKHRMVQPGKPKPAPTPQLACRRAKGGCGGVTATIAPVDKCVLDRMWTELDKPEFLEHLAGDDHAGRREEITRDLAALDARRIELAAAWAKPGELTMGEWKAARDAFNAQEQALQHELAQPPASTRSTPDVALLREAWPDMTLDEQREVVRMFVERVVVRPTGRQGGRVFNHRRVEIEWRKR